MAKVFLRTCSRQRVSAGIKLTPACAAPQIAVCQKAPRRKRLVHGVARKVLRLDLYRFYQKHVDECRSSTAWKGRKGSQQRLLQRPTREAYVNFTSVYECAVAQSYVSAGSVHLLPLLTLFTWHIVAAFRLFC